MYEQKSESIVADRYKKINIYDMYPNSGELELGANTQNPTASANFTNRTALDNSYFDAMVGGSYQPMNEQNTINPRVGLGMGSGNLNINALMDEYQKSANANVGNFSGGITKTADDELIKRLGYNNNNINANIVKDPYNTTYSIEGLLGNMFGGDVTAEAMKDDYNKRIMFNYLKNF